MELLIENIKNKGKVMDKCLFNQNSQCDKSRIKNIMSCCTDLQYLLYYWYDLHSGMSGDQIGENSWFVSHLSLSQFCQPDHKKLFNKKLLSNLEYEISKQKTNFLPPR